MKQGKSYFFRNISDCRLIFTVLFDICRLSSLGGAPVMGYDVVRFEGSVDEELICPICSAVLEDPRLAPE